ncbi:type I-E CRISPR-associated protein Cse1/CasA [Quadrisphaera sp. DSM 44207]|uniref:type I-E CRISPR-associated protein Cse1/CasA n=1 Tax=Quadrisphaera sp. DSM 44207 TaxID=1881057 RepID=UPI00088D40B6|nr:type I-E CRISPR-associated protein Cse1/CasA [Quadrisphaera sp. DSM 44207]SDQ03924.1 CRISPR-associated protein, Cse1 family [Quadrisphaera sp. DSM 44207]
MTSFHLDTDPWLPVTLVDGIPQRVSLREVFVRAHEIATVTMASPPGQASLLRILTALAYRITGLDDPAVGVDDWHAARNAALTAGRFDPARVATYFTRWHARFDLFDADRPWRQEPRLAGECDDVKGMNALIPNRPSGNGHTLFSPFHDAAPGTATIAEAVEALLVRQFYGPNGTTQSRALPGKASSKHFTYTGPLRARVSYHPLGVSLFETLLAHLVPPVTVHLGSGPDLAEWETDTLPDPDGVKPSPMGIIGLLANDSGHALLLIPGVDQRGQVAVTGGYFTWRFADKTAGNLVGWDPYLSYKQEKKDRIARPASLDRDLWRDLPALLASAQGAVRDPAEYQQPQVAVALAGLPPAVLKRVRIAAYAFVQHPFQAIDHDWMEAMYPQVFESAAANPEDASAHEYRTAVPGWVAAAEREFAVLSDALYRALRDARSLDPKGKAARAWAQAGTGLYWQRAYAVFDRALSAPGGAAFAKTVADAPVLLRRISVDLYDQLTRPVQDPRGLRAVIRHRPMPRPSLRQVPPVGSSISLSAAVDDTIQGDTADE